MEKILKVTVVSAVHWIQGDRLLPNTASIAVIFNLHPILKKEKYAGLWDRHGVYVSSIYNVWLNWPIFTQVVWTLHK